MPEAEYTTTTRLPVETVWRFVEEMDNWGGFLRGYQQHTKLSREVSHWVLKGDVGAVSRTVEFEVCIEEWRAPSYVRFSLKGLNEAMEGGGEFWLSPAGADAAPDAPGTATPGAAGAKRPGFFARLVRRLYRLLFGRVSREGREDAGARSDADAGAASSGAGAGARSDAGSGGASSGAGADVGAGGPGAAASASAASQDDTGARLVFRLKVTPGGPMGPMVEALMKPLMLPVAEELAEKIMAELEAREAGPLLRT